MFGRLTYHEGAEQRVEHTPLFRRGELGLIRFRIAGQ